MEDVKHTIFDHEIDPMLEALDALFCPQEGQMDPRAAYQRIYHGLHDIKERLW